MNRALIETLLPDWPALTPEARQAAGDAAYEFTVREISLAPLHVGFCLHALGAGFSLFARIVAAGRAFQSLPLARRQIILRRWSRLGFPFAAYLRVLRSLSLLAFIEHPATLAAMEIESAKDKQARFRAERSRAFA